MAVPGTGWEVISVTALLPSEHLVEKRRQIEVVFIQDQHGTGLLMSPSSFLTLNILYY